MDLSDIRKGMSALAQRPFFYDSISLKIRRLANRTLYV